jgi:hypothetical protein
VPSVSKIDRSSRRPSCSTSDSDESAILPPTPISRPKDAAFLSPRRSTFSGNEVFKDWIQEGELAELEETERKEWLISHPVGISYTVSFLYFVAQHWLLLFIH